MLDNKTVLITGGTGSFGMEFTRIVLSRYRPKRLIIFSRDELKQFEMEQLFPKTEHHCIRYFIGDVRDRERLYRAFDGVDIVIHAAALKQLPSCEYNPLEAIKTNVLGASNVIDAAIDRNVKNIIAVSTDKSVNPVNLYGATKLCSDKLFIAAKQYAGIHESRFSVVRYGNVVGSRGSVIPLFTAKKTNNQPLPITDLRMTRFWISINQGVEFVLSSLEMMQGGEIFIPKMPSMSIVNLGKAIAGEGYPQSVTGIRPGEKLHEVLITEDDARNTIEYEKYYMIKCNNQSTQIKELALNTGGKVCAEAFRYSSGNNKWNLTINELREMISHEVVSNKKELF